ncbi:MAG: hypothetical protein AAFY29_23385 [Pseudomonadota bacterium]
MPEPTTSGLGAIAAQLQEDGVARLLGPTAEYLGEELEVYTQRRIDNVGRIFARAEAKLGSKLDQPGQVPPKVLKTIINDGCYADNLLAIEYFGGVLASSRTENGRDDRGARIARMVDSMSSFQLRSHFITYAAVASVFQNKSMSIGDPAHREAMQLFIPYAGWADAMELTNAERQSPQLVSHIWFGLANDGLIGPTWYLGDRESIKQVFDAAPSDGVVCEPSILGAELLLWALGSGNSSIDDLLTGQLDLSFYGAPVPVEGAIPIKG